MSASIYPSSQKLNKRERTATVLRVIHATSAQLGVSAEDMLGEERRADFVRARHVAQYICRSYFFMTLQAIADEFGRDHSSISHGANAIAEALDSDEALKIEIEAICALILPKYEPPKPRETPKVSAPELHDLKPSELQTAQLSQVALFEELMRRAVLLEEAKHFIEMLRDDAMRAAQQTAQASKLLQKKLAYFSLAPDAQPEQKPILIGVDRPSQ